MNIVIEMVGTSHLLHHNPRLVDPNDEYVIALKVLTSKRKKTEEDLRQIEKLEWYGGLHTMPNGNGKPVVSQPTSKPRKAIINAAKINKLGKSIERALYFKEIEVVQAHDGPKDIDKLYEDQRFHSRLSVGLQGKRVMRVRPKFFPWSMTVRGIFIEDAGINFDELVRVIELSGVVSGIGDNRVNGYGRYTATVKEVK